MRENMFDAYSERLESGLVVREVKHVCQSCGQMLAVHEHASYQEVKDCLAGMRPLCADCDSWPGCPSARADAGHKEAVEPFTEAIEIVGDVMRHGAASHPDNDWLRRTPEYHIRRALEHMRLWQDGDQLQNHISHAATRLLMALTLREIG